MEGQYLKKVKGKSFYFCQSGQEVSNIIESLENPGDITSIVLPVSAYDQPGNIVAEFKFTWSLKMPEH
ncbi:MAG: hypothetical protein M3R25_09730, partial [Bacteroidota bacterium]|nr:hypothetical protein [Bacteroidota bacterium]